MITCNGLVVGVADTKSHYENLLQCVSHLRTYPNLLKVGTSFEVNRKTIYKLIDIKEELNGVKIYFETFRKEVFIFFVSESRDIMAKCFQSYVRGLIPYKGLESCMLEYNFTYEEALQLYKEKYNK